MGACRCSFGLTHNTGPKAERNMFGLQNLAAAFADLGHFTLTWMAQEQIHLKRSRCVPSGTVYRCGISGVLVA